MKQDDVVRKQFLLVLYMYMGYAGFMILKTSVVGVSAAIVGDKTLSITDSQWANIVAWGTLGGILGKLISGVLADRLGGKFTFTLGLLITTLSIVFFGFGRELFVFNAIYFAALCAKSSGWPSMAKLIGNWYSPKQYGRVWGILSTSSRVGTIIATFGVGMILHYLHWRQVLWVFGGIGGGLVLMSFLFIKEHPPVAIKDEGIEQEQGDVNHPLKGLKLAQALWVFATSKRVWLITLSMMGLTIMWDFLNFLPLYLKNSLNLSDAAASSVSTAFPVGSFFSVLVGGYLFDKLSKKAITRLIGLFLTLAVASLGVVYFLSHFGLSEQMNKYITLFCLLVFGFTVSPAYYLPMSIFSIEFGGPHSGILISLLDAFGFAASMAFSFFAAVLLKNKITGWGNFFISLIVVAVLSMLVTVMFLHGEDKVSRKE